MTINASNFNADSAVRKSLQQFTSESAGNIVQKFISKKTAGQEQALADTLKQIEAENAEADRLKRLKQFDTYEYNSVKLDFGEEEQQPLLSIEEVAELGKVDGKTEDLYSRHINVFSYMPKSEPSTKNVILTNGRLVAPERTVEWQTALDTSQALADERYRRCEFITNENMSVDKLIAEKSASGGTFSADDSFIRSAVDWLAQGKATDYNYEAMAKSLNNIVGGNAGGKIELFGAKISVEDFTDLQSTSRALFGEVSGLHIGSDDFSYGAKMGMIKSIGESYGSKIGGKIGSLYSSVFSAEINYSFEDISEHSKVNHPKISVQTKATTEAFDSLYSLFSKFDASSKDTFVSDMSKNSSAVNTIMNKHRSWFVGFEDAVTTSKFTAQVMSQYSTMLKYL